MGNNARRLLRAINALPLLFVFSNDTIEHCLFGIAVICFDSLLTYLQLQQNK